MIVVDCLTGKDNLILELFGIKLRPSLQRDRLAAFGSNRAFTTRVAFEICGVDRVEIRIEPANTRSMGVPRKLGYAEEATLGRRLPPQEEGGPPRDVIIFTMFAPDCRGRRARRRRSLRTTRRATRSPDR